MWSSIYEIRVSYECGAKTYDGAIESCYEDFLVRVEGVGYVEVVGGECLERVFELLVRWGLVAAGDCYVCASMVVWRLVLRVIWA